MAQRRITRPLTTASIAVAIVGCGSVLPASASTVRSEDFVITYLAAPGERNRLALDQGPDGPDGPLYTITDPGAHIHAGPGCTSNGAEVVCDGGTVVVELGDLGDSLRFPPDNRGPFHPGCCIPTSDRLRAKLGSGNDRVAVSFGTATVEGNAGHDSVWSWGQNGFAMGGSGNDLINLSVNTDAEAFGEDGHDRLVIDAEGSGVIDGGSGRDRLTGGGFAPTFFYTGGEGNDILGLFCDDPRCDEQVGTFIDAKGGPGDDLFRALPRPHPTDFGWGAIISGGDGLDVVDYSSSTANLNITLDDQRNDGDGSGFVPDDQDNAMSDIENVIGGSGDDRLFGSALANLLDGNGGHDELTGAGAQDRLLGRKGDDTFQSQDGTVDVVICGLGLDQVFGDPFDLVDRDCEH